MGGNFIFLVIFDTCDVMYNWSISLLPPVVLDNLFGLYERLKSNTYSNITPVIKELSRRIV